MRIACLVPSATDLVASLGLADQICGISHECDHPEVSGRTVVTRARVAAAPAVAPEDVDAEVRATLAAGESLYVADQAALAELRPDWVIGQSVCDVCAVTPDEARRALPDDAELLTLSGTSFEGLAADLRALGGALARPERATARLEAVEAALSALPPVSGEPTVIALEWSAPPFLGGHWVPELVQRAGGRHLLAAPGTASKTTSFDAIAEARPDHIVFMPCGYDLAAAHAEAVASAPLRRAARSAGAQLWATDANRLFSRLTPDAVVQGARTLSAILRADAPEPSVARPVPV